MRALLIRVGVCLICVVAATALGQDKQTDSTGQLIERKYDRFKDETTVKLKPQRILDSKSPRQVLEMSIEATFKGEQPKQQDEEVNIIFISSATDKLYRDPADLNFIIDGERVKGGPAIAGRPYLLEKPLSPDLKTGQRIRSSISFTTLRKIASSKVVEIKLESTELTLDSTSLSNLRKFASAVFNK
jgi:hypothetical protein